MNILFVGPYKQFSESGRKRRAILGALKKTSHNVAARPLYIPDQHSGEAVQSWNYNEEAEYSNAEGYDILIQCTSPVFSVYDGNFKKNIGIFNTQTIPKSNLCTDIRRMGLMDEVWVESQKVSDAIKNLCATQVSVIKPYMDPFLEKDTVANSYPEGILTRADQFKGKFIFYAIGNLSEMEGTTELISAYFSEFSQSDQCVLMYILERPLDGNVVNETIETCYKSTGAIRPLSQKPHIHVLNPENGLPPEARLKIHQEGDCYIHPHYALNWSSLIMEAINAQSTPLINKNTPTYDLWGEKGLWGVDSYQERCLLGDRKFDDLFTSNQEWVRPVIGSLAQQMRQAYTDKFTRDQKKMQNAELKRELESDKYYESLEELLCLQ